MISKAVLCLIAFAIFFSQACSKDSHREVSDPQEEGSLAGDHETIVRSADGKFLCDFQWTKGPEEWNYEKASGDNPVDENNISDEPWCLIPYEDSTGFTFYTKLHEGEESYICRDLNANYSLKNEQVFDINEIYETHTQMMCVTINSVFVTVKNLNIDYKDERLYHIRKTEGLYSIYGHLNLRLVRPVHLKVFWEPIWNLSMINGLMAKKLDVDKIKNDWKKYMLMAGYYIDITTVPIVFPNAMEKLSGNVDDGALTLPQEKDILELPNKIISWYNESVKVINSIGSFFGVDIDIKKIEEANYVIATTPGYKIKYDVEFRYFEKEGNLCVVGFTLAQNIIIINNKGMSIFESFSGYFYDKNGKYIGLGNGVGTMNVYGTDESGCKSITQARYENKGDKADAFSISKGYVLSDKGFFETKNAGRLLAALLYSKIRGVKNPVNENDDGLWLSSYHDDGLVEQPSEHWKIREAGSSGNGNQSVSPEFASIMRIFEKK